MERPRFVTLVPVKPPAHGKSRLRGLGDDERRRLAAAFALDTVAACLATPSVAAVLCVTDDARFAADLAATGCAVLPDGVADDLNEALRLAAHEAARRWPDLVPVAVCADLPALRPHDLEGALLSWAGAAGFVVDSDGTGTTMYVAPTVDFDPRFGHHSRADHLAAGAREIDGALPTLRRDVDDAAALAQAEELGLGIRTAEVLAGLQTR
ncbi:2-phospho-L-lactate guanylyltransferase [Nocardioides euryhalodurans]|uniref:2-phospho-L-lactate guanylyltransferase n=1 Tax=Nocardioides euryhalodurans TaxID=2518370 RepID=A0A4P7GP80_9ACTN|nr:2-phospho-L-lactate guanylyltransferase [Nocardioides euryhalodurans]QBR94035.1 2-phospho-L-lactate guanylyltransferase [Nocardioides euryhalodurans]